MTDITDQDLCKALAWAEGSMARGGADAAARYILATVDAPAPTLAEEVKKGLLFRVNDTDAEGIKDALDLAARVEQIEQERDDLARARESQEKALHEHGRLLSEARAERDQARSEAKAWEERFRAAKDDSSELAYDLDNMYQRALEAEAEVERLTAERVTDPSLTLNDGSMTRPATVAREENVYPDLPDPADVKPREAWIVNIDGVEIVPGFKASVGWICYRFFGGTTKAIGDERITLVSRLVPAPRVSTDTDDLDTLAEGTIVRGGDGHAWENVAGKWCGHRAFGAINTGALTHSGPVTVLWTPEVAA